MNLFNFTWRSRRLFYLLVSLVVTGICILNFCGNFRLYLDLNFKCVIPAQTKNSDSESEAAQCRIPITPTMPEYFRYNEKWKIRRNATFETDTARPQLAQFTQDEKVLVLRSDLDPANCCIRMVLKTRSDNKFNLTEVCAPLKSASVELNENMEVFALECNKSGNSSVELKAAIPKKSVVRKKMEIWRQNSNSKSDFSSTQDTPINILMLGFDSTSRAHALRSLPKTVEYMTKNLSFFDFDQYHSIAPSTLTNFMAVLMGLQRPEVRASCASDWSSPFDPCPFIWKEFGAKNYVTNFLEDGTGTFNWGGQSGFNEEPTDFYIHRFFLALENFQKKNVLNNIVNVPHFSLNYTTRFLRKFRNIPFFSFTWFAYPYHDNMYALREMDDLLLQFFQTLAGNPFQGLLERTLILFFSDHGDRTSFFSSSSPESFIERGAPPLFIRLPEILERKYPELKLRQVLNYNSKILTTPFDVHQTLRHVLSLSCPNSSTSTGFLAQLEDRSSLLVKLPGDRNCSRTNIPPANCLCNLSYQNESAVNSKTKFVIDKQSPGAEKLLKFATDQLNLIVENSEYRDTCQRWTTTTTTTTSEESIRFVRVIAVTNKVREILMAFKANDGAAQFDARIRIHGQGELELVGFSRINKYAGQSFCVKTGTDADKNMKEFCVCKKHD